MSVKTCKLPPIAVWALSGDGVIKLRAMIIIINNLFIKTILIVKL